VVNVTFVYKEHSNDYLLFEIYFVRSTETRPFGLRPWENLNESSPPHSLERRWSNRRFPYGYLVTTSSQSPASP